MPSRGYRVQRETEMFVTGDVDVDSEFSFTFPFSVSVVLTVY